MRTSRVRACKGRKAPEVVVVNASQSLKRRPRHKSGALAYVGSRTMVRIARKSQDLEAVSAGIAARAETEKDAARLAARFSQSLAWLRAVPVVGGLGAGGLQ